MRIVTVLIPRAVNQPFDYSVPAHIEVKRGDFVCVPLGQKQVQGVVWGEAMGDVPAKKLKAIIHTYDLPPLSPQMRDFIAWVADYTLSPLGMVLRLAMSEPRLFADETMLTAYRATAERPARMTPQRQRIYEVLAQGEALPISAIAHAAGVSAASVSGLVKSGFLEAVALPKAKPLQPPRLDKDEMTLSPAQAKIAEALKSAINAKTFSAHLLDGVTGSGKTEIYIEAMKAALMAGQQVLVLLPEISLTQQFLHRFESRFSCTPALWHSGLPANERRRNWLAAANGEAKILIGARSALFLPWQNLGLIVIDEEHDGGYKQEEQVVYNARDMAVVRARFAACPVLLASATPSLESVVNARHKRYQLHQLAHRHGAAQLPDIEIADMRLDPPERGQWLAPTMVKMIAATLAKQQQALLFLNRRGYAPLVICRACGHRYGCDACDSWMVEHRYDSRLLCHHCGNTQPLPHQCTACGEADALVAVGPGVERICEEAATHFPDHKISVLSSDMPTPVLQQALTQIIAGEIDIIIGTQIVAKGHHFPKLGFVGVVDADLGLGNGDLRAAERTFQLISQVAGRAGREQQKGYAMLQTRLPDHPVLQAIATGDREAFLAREIEARGMAAMPPFGRLAGLIISGSQGQSVHAFCREMARHIPLHPDIRVLGPAPAPIVRLRGRYRHRFLVKAIRGAPIQDFIRQWLEKIPVLKGNMRITVDIDPYSFL